MFLHTEETLALSEACLHSVYASLNAPVVQVDALPVGPVRAVIVIYAEPYGDLGLVVGMRDLEGGKTAIYRYRGALGPDEADQGFDDALHFAEGLGFLFDDNMLATATTAGRKAALEYWLSLMGEGDGLGLTPEFDSAASSSAVDVCEPEDLLETPMEDLLDPVEDLLLAEGDTNATGELLLDDLIPLDAAAETSDELEVDPYDSGQSDDLLGETALGIAPAPSLTKFRGMLENTAPEPPVEPDAVQEADLASRAEVIERISMDETETDPPAVPGGSALGRIPIVRRRQGGDAGKPSFVSRLLASF
jgi:hypothetical protein